VPRTQLATGSAPTTCCQCHWNSDSTCILCHRALCSRCRRGRQCINTGDCKNYIDPPATKGKGKGKAKGMSNKQLLASYNEMAAKVNAYVDNTGRGRRSDGTWGTGALAAMGTMWLTAPQFTPTGQCGRCSWRSTDLWRCTYCHMELCHWHSSWEGRSCHCAGGCDQQARRG
jgi:hypothetical protein